MLAANLFRTLATLIMAVTAINNALGGSLTAIVTGGAVAVTCALLAISCTIQARTRDAAPAQRVYVYPEEGR